MQYKKEIGKERVKSEKSAVRLPVEVNGAIVRVIV